MGCNDETGRCPENTTSICVDWEIGRGADSCYINGINNEILNIGGADVNVYKLMGLYEQGRLIDLAKLGDPLSSGFNSSFAPDNAYINDTTEWRSFQRGTAVMTSAYIGYDFGEIKLGNGRLKYSDETHITEHITLIKIKQGNNSQNRITKARIERSDDGIQWKGSAIIDLPDTNLQSIIEFKQSAKARFWRIRPILFNGGPSDFWSVVTLELHHFKSTQLNTLQEGYVFLEQRERDYSDEAIKIKAMYSPSSSDTYVSEWGTDMSHQQFNFQIHFDYCVGILLRPIVVGDILEVPSESYFTPTMEPVLKFLEVTDVSWHSEGVTQGWLFTLIKVTAVPALASQETQDIFGDLAGNIDSSETIEIDTSKYQDISDVSDNIAKQSKEGVPVMGADLNNITEIPADYIREQYDKTGINLSKLNANPNQVFVEDGLPPNGLSYTSGDSFPPNPINGDYHRVTYDDISTNIPARLYRWSEVKDRWIYMETDRRKQHNKYKTSLSNKINSDNRIPSREL